jgi:hypothetical protein
MNWGYKILFGYLTFAAGIIFLCIKAGNEKFDLVETNYYEAELKYQDRINENNRTASLSEPVKVVAANGQLEIVFPKEFNEALLEGEAVLYYAADAGKDVKQLFSSTNGTYTLSVPKANKGLHTLKLSWKVNGEHYYYEEKLFL